MIRAWTFYDWANSVYPLVITSAVFPLYYEGVTHQGNSDMVTLLGFTLKNTSLYTYALSFAYLLIAFLSPLLSGIADYTGHKKTFLRFFCCLGSLACSLMYFFTAENLWLGIVLIILACVGYSGSLVFYNAFLPEVATPDKQDQVSARGFAMGYIGSASFLIFVLTMMLMPQWYGGITKGEASRLAFLLVGLWWFSFAQYPLHVLPQNDHLPPSSKGHIVFRGYLELKKVWAEMRHDHRLPKFLPAFFVYIMGLQTVMLVATLFGKKELHMETGQLIVTILLLQFLAIAGAYLFAFSARKMGNIITLKGATLIWVGICCGAYLIQTPTQFYVLAACVGLVMGGTQSLSRSTYSKFITANQDHASYFSFYDVTEKLAIVFGTALFGLLEQMTDSMRNPVLGLLVLFVIGFALLMRVPENKIA